MNKKILSSFIILVLLLLSPSGAQAQQTNSCRFSNNTFFYYIYNNYYVKEPYSDNISILITKNEKKNIEEELKKYDEEIKMLAKIIYREARGEDKLHQAAVVWCVLNRVDCEGKYGNTIESVIKAKHQFAWRPKTPILDKFYNLAEDVIIRWLLEKSGYDNVGRVLPKDYYFFAAHNGQERFRKEYRSRNHWDWSLPSPYDNEEYGE